MLREHMELFAPENHSPTKKTKSFFARLQELRKFITVLLSNY
jgi:hypothetical protein